VAAGCGHVFCCSCITDFVATVAKGAKCPQCNKLLSVGECLWPQRGLRKRPGCSAAQSGFMMQNTASFQDE
jgi:hypothetical protein